MTDKRRESNHSSPRTRGESSHSSPGRRRESSHSSPGRKRESNHSSPRRRESDHVSSREADGRSGDFQDAVGRLETAVHELVGSAKGQFSDRAATFIDDTAARIEKEFATRKTRSQKDRSRRRHRNRQRAQRIEGRSRRLYRDPRHGKIGGVCAGIANYYSMETWVVRCIAITGLLFMGQFVFPAYWIAYFAMDKPPKNPSIKNASNDEYVEQPVHVSPAPELGPRFSPRGSLRNVEADFSEVELRLRRMESHVTSGKYELQKELRKIEEDGHGTMA
ncbi:MAG: envelope stress response membrane protein PspC [Gammaproteobacteria bacterium]|nr:envelope stress response membrane protein PspC [Gammaproteobacteria bacterium]